MSHRCYTMCVSIARWRYSNSNISDIAKTVHFFIVLQFLLVGEMVLVVQQQAEDELEKHLS